MSKDTEYSANLLLAATDNRTPEKVETYELLNERKAGREEVKTKGFGDCEDPSTWSVV